MLFKRKPVIKVVGVEHATEPEMAMLRNVAVGAEITLADVQGGGTYKVTAHDPDANMTVLDNWKTVESNLLVYL